MLDYIYSFQLEKVLQACEIADASEPYASCAAKDDRTREKLSAAAADYCERLGRSLLPVHSYITVFFFLPSLNVFLRSIFFAFNFLRQWLSVPLFLKHWLSVSPGRLVKSLSEKSASGMLLWIETPQCMLTGCVEN